MFIHVHDVLLFSRIPKLAYLDMFLPYLQLNDAPQKRCIRAMTPSGPRRLLFVPFRVRLSRRVLRVLLRRLL